MATLTKSDIAELSVTQRFALIEVLWDSIDETLDAAPPHWHREELDRILDEEERNPQPTVAWEDIRAEWKEKWLP